MGAVRNTTFPAPFRAILDAKAGIQNTSKCTDSSATSDVKLEGEVGSTEKNQYHA